MATLPEEMLDLICWELVGDSKTLHNLMRSSRALHRLAEPVFYHTLTVGDESGKISLRRLFKICLARPRIAALIKRIDFGYFSTNPDESSASLTYYYEKALTVMRSIGLAEHWQAYFSISILDKNVQDIAIASILLMCKNLLEIDLNTSDWSNSMVLDVASEMVIEPSLQRDIPRSMVGCKPLQLLRTVNISRNRPDTETVQPIVRFVEIFKLPSVETFIGSAVELDAQRCNPSDRYALKSIHVSICLVRTGGLTWLLTACPSLARLELEIYNSPRVRPNLDEIGDSLRRLGAQLEHLKLYKANPSSSYCHGALGDLSSLNRLKTLRLELQAIYGEDEARVSQRLARGYLVENLPPSLEVLSIGTTMRIGFEHFMYLHFLEMVTSDRFPRLSTVRVAVLEAMISEERHEFTSLTVPMASVDCTVQAK